MQKENVKNIPIEINPLKRDTFKYYRSNSLLHHKDISNYNYEHRIRLDPAGESKMMDIRNQIPTNKIQDCYTKTNHLNYKYTKNANEKAIYQGNINRHIKSQRHQNLLRNDKHIKRICQDKNNELKAILENSKLKLKNELTQIIKDAIRFSKNNNPIKSMLPRSLSGIEKVLETEADDKPLCSNKMSLRKKKEFLYMIGVDIDRANENNVDIDINKCWNYIFKLSRGRKIEDLLRYKVVNEIMNITEKKSAEKAKKIYEKLDIYKKYMAGKKNEENRRKKLEEEKMKQTLKTNTKEYIKLKIQKSLSQPKIFTEQLNIEDIKNKNKRNIKRRNIKKDRKKMKRCESEIENNKKNVMRLDSYNDVNKIIDFIDNSKSNSQSKLCRGHFANIQMTKNINTSLQKMITKNDITCK